ncbi:MAG: hypothetical protein ACTSRE_07195 [Promethearchaeota archaeon]
MFLTIIGLTSFSGTVTAHSPDYMKISYNQYNSILTVNITHTVEDETTHYIEGVKICLQEDVHKIVNYTSQPIEGEIHDDIVVGSVQSSLDIPGYANIGLVLLLSITLLVGITVVRIKKI